MHRHARVQVSIVADELQIGGVSPSLSHDNRHGLRRPYV